MPAEPAALAGVLRDRWPLPTHHAVREELLAAYGQGRGYHDLRHLREVLDRLAELRCEEVVVLLAAWFHDAVYDGAPDDEERSAQWAERALPPMLAGEVGRLVRVTARHDPAEDDDAGQLLCDADLAILAAPAARRAEYTADVRREFAHLDDATFAAGRAEILADLLARPTLFHTPAARERWEEAARAHVAAELDLLTRG